MKLGYALALKRFAHLRGAYMYSILVWAGHGRCHTATDKQKHCWKQAKNELHTRWEENFTGTTQSCDSCNPHPQLCNFRLRADEDHSLISSAPTPSAPPSPSASPPASAPAPAFRSRPSPCPATSRPAPTPTAPPGRHPTGIGPWRRHTLRRCQHRYQLRPRLWGPRKAHQRHHGRVERGPALLVQPQRRQAVGVLQVLVRPVRLRSTERLRER